MSVLSPAGDITFGSVNGTQLVYADEVSRLTVNEGFTHTDNEIDVFEGVFKLTDQHYSLVTVGTNFNKSFAVLGQNANVGASLSVSRGLSRPPARSFPSCRHRGPPLYASRQATSTTRSRCQQAITFSHQLVRPVGRHHHAAEPAMGARRIRQPDGMAARDHGGRQRHAAARDGSVAARGNGRG